MTTNRQRYGRTDEQHTMAIPRHAHKAAVYSASWETYLRATRRHLPYGITQCYLPPNTSEGAPP